MKTNDYRKIIIIAI